MDHGSIEALLAPDAGADGWARLPGLFRKWELEEVIDLGNTYRFESAGSTEDGTPLVAIYVLDSPGEGR